MAQRILAIEFSENVVRAAVAERSWNSFELIGTHYDVRNTDESDIRGALKRIVERVGRVDITVSAISGRVVAKRLLSLPFSKLRQLEQAVPFALEEHLPFAIDEGVVSFFPLKLSNNGSSVLALFVLRRAIQEHLELLAEVNLDPKLVSVTAVALPAVLVPESSDHAKNQKLLLEICGDIGNLVLIDDTGSIRAFRSLPVAVGEDGKGGRDDSGDDASLHLAAAQILKTASEASTSVELIAIGECGEELRVQLANELGLSLGEPDASAITKLLPGFAPEHIRFAGCIGLLLSEHPHLKLELPNFRQGEFLYLGRTTDWTVWHAPVALAVVAIFLGIMHASLDISIRYRRLKLIDNQLSAIASPVLGHRPAADVIPGLHKELVKLKKELQILESKHLKASPLDVLLSLSRAITPNLGIELDELAMEGNEVRISGFADSYAGVALLKQALSRDEKFADVQVAEARSEAGGGKVEFRATLHLRQIASNTL